jgi:hypothetical protein
VERILVLIKWWVGRYELQMGKGSYPPEKIILPKEDFDALVDRLNEPPEYDEKIARVLQRKAPWDD